MGKYVPDEDDVQLERPDDDNAGLMPDETGDTKDFVDVLHDKVEEANTVKHLDDDYDKFFRSFTNIRPEGDQIERIETIRDDYKAVLSTIIALTNRTPERTIALRKLEESLMYAVKCIALET